MINRIKAHGDYELVQSKDECCYQDVLDDFENASEIYIMTFNISTRNDELIRLVDDVNKDISVHLITNIPSRFDRYLGRNNGEYARSRARSNINYYLTKLDPGARENDFIVFFNFDNHSKIIMTDNIAYIGSANYSLESSNNYESGFITRDYNVIEQIKEIFVRTVEQDSIRYHGTELTKLEVMFMSFYSQINRKAEEIFNSLFWEDDRENSHYNAISAYINWDDIEEVNGIVYDYKEKILELEDNELFLELSERINERNLDDLNQLYYESGSMYELAMFDNQDYMDNYLNEHLMEAYDEYLDEYAQNASDLANEERERLATKAKREVVSFYEKIRLFEEQLEEVLDIISELKREEQNNVDNT